MSMSRHSVVYSCCVVLTFFFFFNLSHAGLNINSLSLLCFHKYRCCMWLEDTFTLSVGSVTVCARPTSGGHKPNMSVCVLRLSSANKQTKKRFISQQVMFVQLKKQEHLKKALIRSYFSQSNVRQTFTSQKSEYLGSMTDSGAELHKKSVCSASHRTKQNILYLPTQTVNRMQHSPNTTSHNPRALLKR